MYDEDALEDQIKSSFRVLIDEAVVHDSFPHYDLPTEKDMIEYFSFALAGNRVPEKVEMKMSRKPTKEMLEEFCKKRGLVAEYYPEKRAYLFRLASSFNWERESWTNLD